MIANYVTDQNDVIAIKGKRGAPEKLKNPSDWRLFQELTAQAGIIITATSYIRQFSKGSQNVLSQFEAGGEFEDLGKWRLKRGLKRNPDIAVLSRSLDFDIPQVLLSKDRKVIVFTTASMVDSKAARKLRNDGAEILAAGYEGVKGKILSEVLKKKGYGVIKNTTGPRILELLMPVLDRLYITRVKRAITKDFSKAIFVFKDKKVDELVKQDFKLVEIYRQERVTTNDGCITSQKFLVFEKLK